MFCKQCGNEIIPGARFCAACGTPVEVAPQPVQAVAEQPVETAQEVVAQPVETVQAVAEQPVDNSYAQYQQPVQPQYEQPVQPRYAQPQYVQPQYGQPQYAQPMQPQYNAVPIEDPVERELSKSILVFGILGIAFACTFYLSFLGIIFGAIAMGKASKYVASGYILNSHAKVGKILGIAGLIIGIILTVILVFVIVAAIVAIITYGSYFYYYY